MKGAGAQGLGLLRAASQPPPPLPAPSPYLREKDGKQTAPRDSAGV